MGNTVNTSRRLSEAETRTIAGMIQRGDRIQDVAYFFSVSPATVHRIKKAALFVGEIELPPPGPYQLVAKDGYAEIQARALQVDEVKAKLAAADEMVKELEQLLTRHRLRRDELATRSTGWTNASPLPLVH